jgi:hypothetical protein
MARRPLVRVAAVIVAVSVAGLVAASCSSPGRPGQSAASSTTTAHSSTTSSSTTTTSTVPPAEATGPLQLGAPIAVPISAVSVAAAEGPNGAVFVAPQDPLSDAPSIVWVVDGNGPPAIAEHMNDGVAALAADATNLYVAGYATVTAFDRDSGNQDGQWNLPPINTANSSNEDLVSMSASGGSVQVMITQGDTQSIYRIDPGSKGPPRLIARGISAAFGPDGSIYYERADGHVVLRSGSGETTVGSVLADHPNGLGGGVQYLDVVAGGALWVDEPAGQGLDDRYSEYSEKTLHLLGTYDGSTSDQIVGTGAGALVLSLPSGAGACTPAASSATPSCVARLSPTGALMDAVAAGSAFVLLGPAPAVVADAPGSTNLEVERIS